MCLDFSSLACAKRDCTPGMKGLPAGKGDFGFLSALGDPTKTEPVSLWLSGVDGRR